VGWRVLLLVEVNDVETLSVDQWLEHSDGVGFGRRRMVLFFYGGTWEGPFGLFSPSRLRFNLAWLTLAE
jgi:hypothetical protein